MEIIVEEFLDKETNNKYVPLESIVIYMFSSFKKEMQRKDININECYKQKTIVLFEEIFTSLLIILGKKKFSKCDETSTLDVLVLMSDATEIKEDFEKLKENFKATFELNELKITIKDEAFNSKNIRKTTDAYNIKEFTSRFI